MSEKNKGKNEELHDSFSLKSHAFFFPYKMVVVGIAVVSLVLVAGVTGSLSSANHRVTLNVDGVVRPVEGWMVSVSDVLEQANVTVNPYDIVTPEIDSLIKDGQTITVQSAHKVYVRDEQERKEMWVVSDTIFDTVQALKIADKAVRLIVERSGHYQVPIASHQIKVTLQHGDKEKDAVVAPGTSLEKLFERNSIEPGPLDEVTARSVAPGHLLVAVDHITRKVVTEKTELDFKTKKSESPDLYKDEEKVITKGKPGVKVTKYLVHTVNDKQIRKVELASSITKKPVDEIVEVGSKDRPEVSFDNFASGTSSTPARPSAPANPSAVQEYARSILPDFGMADSEFGCVVELFSRESGWRWNATNPSSGAYGIPQALPGSKMASAGADWRTNPETQVRWGLKYISSRYGTPCNALNVQRSRGWY